MSARDWDDDIADLFPLDLSGEVVALRASIDASTRTDGVFTVAGVAFGYERAVKANREWERLMDGRSFHMKDLNNRCNDFHGVDDKEVDRIMKGVVSIVRQYASYVVCISCESDLVADSLPAFSSPDATSRAMLAAFRSVYGFMCHLEMFTLGGLASNGRSSRKRAISYIFERGDKGQKGLKMYLDYIQSIDASEPLLDGYSLVREVLTPKDQMEGIFHSSDLVAWEWGKHVGRHRSGTAMRGL